MPMDSYVDGQEACNVWFLNFKLSARAGIVPCGCKCRSIEMDEEET